MSESSLSPLAAARLSARDEPKETGASSSLNNSGNSNKKMVIHSHATVITEPAFGSPSQRRFTSSIFDKTRKIKIHQEEEESSVHHRESFSSATSVRDGSRRTAEMSSSSAREASASMHSSSRHQTTSDGATISSSSHHRSADLAASHFSKASLRLETDKEPVVSGEKLLGARSSFHNSFDASSSSAAQPDVNSLVKEVETSFRELENFALISASGPSARLSQAPSRTASSLSSRLFGGERQSLLSSMHERRHDHALALMASDANWSSQPLVLKTDITGRSVGASRQVESGSRTGDRIQELLSKAQGYCERAGVVNRSVLESERAPASTTDSSTRTPAQPAAESATASRLRQNRCKAAMSEPIELISKRMSDLCKTLGECSDTKEAIELLKFMIQTIEKAWSVRVCGYDLGFKLCSSLREAGGLDVIISIIHDSDELNRLRLESLNLDAQPTGGKQAAAPTAEQQESQKPNQRAPDHQLVSAQAKNNSSPNPLRLNLTKLSHQQSPPATRDESAEAPDSAEQQPQQTGAAKDSDSDILTSDLGLDSTSVESLSYVSASRAPTADTSVDLCSPESHAEDASRAESEHADKPERAAETAAETSSETDTKTEVETTAQSESASLKEELLFLSSRLLSQCLTFDNRNYIVNSGLEPIVRLACSLTLTRSQGSGSASNGGEYSDLHASVGTEILEHLYKHSEDTCSQIIALGGLQAILFGCRSSHIETLRHCASALANLALYGGRDSQQIMIEQKAHVWLFPLAFNEDDNILQYYACLAIVVLAANQEIEADVLKSSTLDLVEPFVTLHEPRRFAESTTSHIHGQSVTWLKKLVPLLESKREEARNLAAFHFAMEAYIKREQGQAHVFKEIGAVEPLRKVGSSPIAVASKFACQALRLIGEQEPHKLSQQVPLWTCEDVVEWVGQIGFERFRREFVDSQVDGDLLLQLDEEMLRTDIGIDNGIIRRRFLRELSGLKRIADYSSVDRSELGALLGAAGGAELTPYVYPLVQLGATRDNIHLLDCDQLLAECRITNTVHRAKLAHALKGVQERLALEAAAGECETGDGTDPKKLDVFVSYRRSTGSQLASLLKVHLQLRGFTVFIDVERLEAGKFDNNLLDSIRAARNFILVLSPSALDRCIGDHECKDWVHKEIVAALASNCNIIPIIDNFHWPDADQLPEDMRSIAYFNGIRWIHDYQDACVEKVERFIRGELSNGLAGLGSSASSAGHPGASGGGGSSNASSLQRVCATSASTPSVSATPSTLAFPVQNSPASAFGSGRVAHPEQSDHQHHPLAMFGTSGAQSHQHYQATRRC